MKPKPKKPNRTEVALEALHQAAIALAAVEVNQPGYQQLAKQARAAVNSAILQVSSRK